MSHSHCTSQWNIKDCIFIADADPEYFFTEKFKKKKKLGYTNRPVKFLCTGNDENAKIRWGWNGKPISVIPSSCNSIRQPQ